MRLALVTLAALLALATPALAAQKTETAESGAIRAELSYTTHKGAPSTDLVERVYDNGTLVVESAIPDKDGLQPGGFGDDPSPHARDLDGDGVAEVVFDLYTGGAHCCFQSDFYDPPAKSHFRQDWGNIGYRFKDYDGDGVPELNTADNAFAYAYGAFAYSVFPLNVYRYRPEGLEDVTADEPAVRPVLIREAGSYKRRYRHYRRAAHRGNVGARDLVAGFLAARAADECSLGHCARGYALIRSAVRRGDVPQFPHFLGTIRLDLQRLGYDNNGVNCACAGPPPAPAPVPQPRGLSGRPAVAPG